MVEARAAKEGAATVVISAKDHEYFDKVEGEMDCAIDLDQRAWYIAKRDSAEFTGDAHDMLREYPSTPAEAWQANTKGKYLAKVMAPAQTVRASS